MCDESSTVRSNKAEKTCVVFVTNEIFLYSWSLLKDLKETALYENAIHAISVLKTKIKTKTKQDPIILKTLKIHLLI